MDNLIKHWIVRYYSRTGKHLNDMMIYDRTEHEASKEAIGDMPYDCEDWSMTEWKGAKQ